ncbi:hypothetical protein DCCM_4524 [Desulfocucumis palustris]|uniref:Prepilin-type N-terminal cleavage/methylation domain-containing protein n=1 Tax=Desulfocucumis palustris TaxID=1898651 RepID=A0A2L2XN69_9FIRM|nr:hypothetical protein [Desulfocucumis palustris]GBF35401.1 hypothetical protein DCCM_4524 [Desulfocucumis palustris]
MIPFLRSERKTGSGGFTLLEVLTAFLVFTLCITAVLDLFFSGLRHQVQAWEETRASFAASAILEQVKEMPFESAESKARAEYSGEPGLNYAVDVGPSARPDMKTISVTVFYDLAGEEKSVKLMMERLNR